MVFKILRSYIFLIFLFTILSDEAFGGRLAELCEEAKVLASQAHMTGRRQFQRDLESLLRHTLESTGYIVSDREVYVDKTFIQRSMEDLRHRLAVLTEERDSLRMLEPKDEGPPSLQSQARNLLFRKRMAENTLAHETVALHLKRLQMRYDLLWGTHSGPTSHTSDLLPPNLERKSGWASYYFVDPSNLLFVVDPSDHPYTQTLFDALFSMFEYLDSQYQAEGQPFPAAIMPVLQTRFSLYTVHNEARTMSRWGRGFMEQERRVFSETLGPLEEEIRTLQFSLEHPHAEGLNIAGLYSRIERLDTTFKELFDGMAILHLEQLVETSVLVATAPDKDDAEFEDLKKRVEQIKEGSLSLQHEVEDSAQRFTHDRDFIEHMPITTIGQYLKTLEESLQVFKKRYKELSLIIKRIQTRLEERENQAYKQLDDDAEALTHALNAIPTLEEKVKDLDLRIKDARGTYEIAVTELTDAQSDARISDVNLGTERFYHRINGAMDTSLGQIVSTFNALSSSAVEMLVEESSAPTSLSEQEGRVLATHLDALESVVEAISSQMDTAVSKFNGLVEGEMAAIQPLTLPETTPFDAEVSLRIASMHMVNQAVRDLFERLHAIIAGHISPATLPPKLSVSSSESRAAEASVAEGKSPLRRLLEELKTLSTSRETIIFIESQTQLLRQQLETLFLNKSKMPSKGSEISSPSPQAISVRA